MARGGSCDGTALHAVPKRGAAHGLASAPDAAEVAERVAHARESGAEKFGSSQPVAEKTKKFRGKNQEQIGQRAASQGEREFVADAGSVEGEPVAPLPFFVVPDMDAGKQVDASAAVGEAEGEVLFLGAVEAGRGGVKTDLPRGGETEKMAAADEHGRGPGGLAGGGAGAVGGAGADGGRREAEAAVVYASPILIPIVPNSRSS